MEQTSVFTRMILEDNDFYRLKNYIEQHAGIKLPLSKKIMVESRLRKRVRALELKTFGEYCNAVFEEGGIEGELLHLIDAVTTNKTDFFREPDHFEFLADVVKRERFSSSLKIWSAACSTGEEPYTIAMVLAEAGRCLPESDYHIIASDICNDALEQGRRGVYSENRIASFPTEYRNRYFLRCKDRTRAVVRVRPEIRSRVSFMRHNLMEKPHLPVKSFDIIFCRNVLIYFNREGQERVLCHLYSHLRPGGYLILGHSETIFGMDLNLSQEIPTVYRKPEERGYEK